MVKKIIIFGIVFLILWPAIAFANSPPNLIEDGVYPPVAAKGTTITYRVTYIDADGDPPAYVRIYFPATPSLQPKEMRKVSGDYKTGAVYEYKWEQQENGYDYRFEASDGKATAQRPWYGGTFSPISFISETLENNKIYLFSKEINKPLWSYDTGGDWVNTLAISDDGSYIAAKTSAYIYLFSRESSAPLWKYECGSATRENINGGVDISAAGDYLVGGCQNSLYLFSRKSNRPIWSYEKEDLSIYSASISADGNFLAFGTAMSDELIFFSRKSNDPLWKYKATADIHGLSVSYNGDLIAAGSHSPEERAYLFNQESNIPLTAYKTSRDSPVWTAAMSRDGKYTAYGLDSADTYTSIFLFSNDKNTPLKTWTTDWWVRAVDLSSNGKYIVAGSGDHNVYLIDRDKDEPLWKFEAEERIGSASISQDGNYIAAGSKDKNVYFFSKESRIPLWNYQTDSWVASVAISADGAYITAGTGAAQYMSEGHNPIYNPEKGLNEELSKTAKKTDAITKEEAEVIIKKTVCGDGICEGAESYESCPTDCCGKNCDLIEEVPEEKKIVEKEGIEPKEKDLFEVIIDFFRRLLGK